MKPASIAPLYCALYPAVAEICRKHGYALAIHGSMGRDFDLICVPWAEKVSAPDEVLKDITTEFAVGEPLQKNHGRLSYAVSVSFGECFFDMSFLPIPAPADCEKWEALREAVNDLMAERYYAANDGALYCDSCHISRQVILTGMGHKPGCSVGDVEQALAALDAKEQD